MQYLLAIGRCVGRLFLPVLTVALRETRASLSTDDNDRVDRAGSLSTDGKSPPSRLRRSGAASFAWLAEPKLTLRLVNRVSEGWWT